MDNRIIRNYIIISVVVILIFILLLLIPFTKKNKNNLNNNSPLVNPTPIIIDNSTIDSTTETSAFTGVAEEELPPQVYDSAMQRQQLRRQTPLDLSTFTVGFNYSEDKFIVTLKDPKDISRNEFNNWKTNNFPAIDDSQFNFQ